MCAADPSQLEQSMSPLTHLSSFYVRIIYRYIVMVDRDWKPIHVSTNAYREVCKKDKPRLEEECDNT